MAARKKAKTFNQVRAEAQKPTETDLLRERVRFYQHDFPAFFSDIYGKDLSNLQESFLWDYHDMWWAKINRVAGKMLTPEEKALAGKFGISIHSGKGEGKDFILAGVIPMTIFLFQPFKGICTATSAKQLDDVLSNEIKRLLNGAKDPWFKRQFTVDKSGIYLMKNARDKSENFMSKRTANPNVGDEEAAGTLFGYHSTYMLNVVDEASGVKNACFNSIEDTLTDPVCLNILIGNPHKNSGYFYDTHYHSKTKKFWHGLRWDKEDSDIELIVPGAKVFIAAREEKYGRDSNPFRITVKGLPPLADKNSLLALDWIYDAVDRKIPHDPETSPKVVGIDVGAGGDKSVAYLRVGHHCEAIKTIITKDSNRLEGWAMDVVDGFDKEATVCVDYLGVGWGLTGRLRANGYNVREVNVSESASTKSKFYRLRDELWWRVRELFEQGLISIPNNEDLINALMVIEVEDWGPPLKIKSKKKMRLAGIPSPDEGDALMHSYILNDAIFTRMFEHEDAYDRAFAAARNKKTTGWMAA